MIKKAMILAAGFGKRIHPLTLKSPKPLLKIGNETLLSNSLKFLESFGIQQVIINVHYLGEQINDYIDTTVMEKNEDYSNRLVGQLKTEKSAQLDFPLKGTETGEQFKKVLENFPDAEMTEVKIKKGEKNE